MVSIFKGIFGNPAQEDKKLLDISDYKFPEVVIKRTKNNLGFTESSDYKIKILEVGLKDYFYAVKTLKVLPMNNKNIDELWHNFILDTKEYREFCENYIGFFIDHEPFIDEVEMTPKETSELKCNILNNIPSEWKRNRHSILTSYKPSNSNKVTYKSDSDSNKVTYKSDSDSDLNMLLMYDFFVSSVNDSTNTNYKDSSSYNNCTSSSSDSTPTVSFCTSSSSTHSTCSSSSSSSTHSTHSTYSTCSSSSSSSTHSTCSSSSSCSSSSCSSS